VPEILLQFVAGAMLLVAVISVAYSSRPSERRPAPPLRVHGVGILEVRRWRIGRCLVCRTLVVDEWMCCPRCRAPHHAGCWAYSGGCAVYACGGLRAIRRNIARPAVLNR